MNSTHQNSVISSRNDLVIDMAHTLTEYYKSNKDNFKFGLLILFIHVGLHWRCDTCGVKDMQYRSIYKLSVDYYRVSQLIATIYCNNRYIYSISQVYTSVSVQKQIGSLFMDNNPTIDCVTLLLLYNTCTYV